MFKFIILLSLLSQLSIADVLVFEDDKQMHFSYSAGIASFTNTAINNFDFVPTYIKKHSLPISFASTLFIGTVKELMDSTETGNKFSEADLVADALGSLVGASISESFNGYFIKIGMKKNPLTQDIDGVESSVGFCF